MSPSIWQILVVVGIFAILFMGPKRIPGIGSSLGEAIRGFKKGLSGEKDDEIDVTDTSQKEQLKDSAQNSPHFEGSQQKHKNKENA